VSIGHRDPIDIHASVEWMRRHAIASIEEALSEKLDRSVSLQRAVTTPWRRGPREQRFVTPAGQVIYLRTRSFDERKPPFFTVQPDALNDADWFVLVCAGRGDVVISGSRLRELAPGLHRDKTGNFKPTFVIDATRCAVYADGGLVDITALRDGYAQIADGESR
jgi:hypothetical protein